MRSLLTFLVIQMSVQYTRSFPFYFFELKLDEYGMCPADYIRIDTWALRRKLLSGYHRHVLANKKEASSTGDRMIQNLMEEGLKRAKCVPRTMYEKLHNFRKKDVSQDSDDPWLDRTIVEWNCHDAECDIPVTLKGIWGYGCWCNFGTDLLKGKGRPINKHDKVCQDMQLCLRCAEIDARENNYKCNVKNTQYNSLLEQSTTDQNDNEFSINSGCSTINGNNICGTHVCTCEMQMINDILALVWEGYTHDFIPRHPDNPFGGSFDYESSCQQPTNTGNLSCCGKYPFRFPYNSNTRDCCQNNGLYETFSSFDQVCCLDGVKNISEGGC